MSKFEDGHKKIGGRSKGTPNKKTEQWDKFSDWFMGPGIQRLSEEMSKLKGPAFIREAKDLIEYFQPKLARNEVTGKDGEPVKLNLVVKDKDDKEFIDKL